MARESGVSACTRHAATCIHIHTHTLTVAAVARNSDCICRNEITARRWLESFLFATCIKKMMLCECVPWWDQITSQSLMSLLFLQIWRIYQWMSLVLLYHPWDLRGKIYNKIHRQFISSAWKHRQCQNYSLNGFQWQLTFLSSPIWTHGRLLLFMCTCNPSPPPLVCKNSKIHWWVVQV